MRGDPYKVLQVDRDAEPEVIEAAFRRLARKYHPDLNAAPDATERMRDIRNAYEVLRDPRLRAEHDRREGTEHHRPEGTEELDRPAATRRTVPSRTAGVRLSVLGGLIDLDLALRRRRP